MGTHSRGVESYMLRISSQCKRDSKVNCKHPTVAIICLLLNWNKLKFNQMTTKQVICLLLYLLTYDIMKQTVIKPYLPRQASYGTYTNLLITACMENLNKFT